MARRAIEAFDLAGSIDHPGENGRAREEAVRRFLAEVLPPDFGIDTGFVIDAIGGISRQVDVVIYRKGRYPVLDVGGVKHFMVESVAAVIEVKAQIGSKKLLRDALNNVGSVKALDRTNGGKNRVAGERWLEPLNFHDQVFSAVVVGASIGIDTCLETVAEWLDGHPRQHWPSMYVDVSNFLVQYVARQDDGMEVRTPDAMSGLRLSAFAGSDGVFGFSPPLSFFAVDLLDFLRVTPVIGYSPSGYFSRSMVSAGNRSYPLDDRDAGTAPDALEPSHGAPQD